MPPHASDPGVYVLHLVGSNDSHAAGRVQGDLWAALGSGSPVVVDLSGATSLEPGVLALIVDAIAACEDTGRSCVLLVPDACAEPVRARFAHDGLGALLPVARTWDDALRRAVSGRLPVGAPVTGGQDPAPGWTIPVS